LLEGKQVRLREYRKEDVVLAHKYINDFEVKRLLFPGIPFPMRLEEEEKWYESQSAFKDTYSFAIESLESGEYLGGCGINEVDWKNSVVIVGIFLGKPFWNKGFGSDAMRILLRFIFEQMNINKVNLNVYSFNERAIASYVKCGFKVEGRLRQRVFRDGKYHDEVIMGILRSEFEQS